MLDDPRYIRQGLHVIDQRWFSKEPGFCRIRRPGSYFGPAAFDRVEQSGLLAADIAPLADDEIDVKRKGSMESLVSQEPLGACLCQRLQQGCISPWIFFTQIDVSALRSDRIARDGHGLENAMRIVLQEEAVHIGARIAFVRIRNYEFFRGILLSNGAPFLASRKARATPPTQPGSITSVRIWSGVRKRADPSTV